VPAESPKGIFGMPFRVQDSYRRNAEEHEGFFEGRLNPQSGDIPNSPCGLKSGMWSAAGRIGRFGRAGSKIT
jgi:hypothetical protein